MKNRFDFEQEIMDCWNITSDLNTLNEAVLEKGMSPDRISNVLAGMEALYQLKFEKLFSTFESLIRERQFDEYSSTTSNKPKLYPQTDDENHE